MAERRIFTRVAADFPLRYRRAPDETPAMAQMRDLGGGGVGVTLKEPFAVGTTLLLEIDLRDRGLWVTLDGTVAWSEPAVSQGPSAPWRPMAAGLRFVRVDASDHRLYRHLFPPPATP